jgi:hypothetical protein
LCGLCTKGARPAREARAKLEKFCKQLAGKASQLLRFWSDLKINGVLAVAVSLFFAKQVQPLRDINKLFTDFGRYP